MSVTCKQFIAGSEGAWHISLTHDCGPGVSRRLYPARALEQPFGFLTWSEYAQKDTDAFDTLVAQLRQNVEWRFVEHEADIGLTRAGNDTQGARA